MLKDYLINNIKNSKHPIAFTGSMLSVMCGFPDLNQNILEHKLKDALTLDFFSNNVLDFYKIFRYLVMSSTKIEPNYIHRILANMNVHIITDNFDNLHQKAGSHNVIELNNNLEYLLCKKCNYKIKSQLALGTLKSDDELLSTITCPHCHNILKPTLVLVGEEITNFHLAVNEINKSDLLLIIGNDLSSWPSNTIPNKAKRINCNIITLNNNYNK